MQRIPRVAVALVLACHITSSAPASDAHPTEKRGTRAVQVAATQAVRANQDDAEAARLVEMMQLGQGATVADIGAGSGMFTAALASHVPPGVSVIATELKAQMRPLLQGLEDFGRPKNVRIVEGAATTTNLPDGSCDALVVRRTYHHLFEPTAMASSFYRTLRRGGRLFVIESPLRPMKSVLEGTPAFRGGDGIDIPVLLKELAAAGFIHERTVDPFVRDLYLAVMRKP